MFQDIGLALRQMDDRRFRDVLIRSLLVTVGLLFAVGFAFIAGVNLLLPETISLPWVGEVAMLGTILSVASVIVIIVLSAFLMFPVASVFVGLFLDEIASAVEAEHYPQLPKVTPTPLPEALTDALRFFGVMVAANLLLLIVYLASTVFAPLIFWAVNGALLGREYFQLVALRRLPLSEATRLRKQNRLEIWMTGALMAIPLSIPFVNLIVPIVGVAVFTHQFHRMNGAKAEV